jgi:long-subunit acyl-CoA synthetase (AMP-forming)
LSEFTVETCTALHAFTSWLYPVLELAIVGAGGVFFGTNPLYTKYELEHALKIRGAKYVFCEAEDDALSNMHKPW